LVCFGIGIALLTWVPLFAFAGAGGTLTSGFA
jgi:hypothetical protein